jgi:hypothetical protein
VKKFTEKQKNKETMKPQPTLAHGNRNKTSNILFLSKLIAKPYHLNRKDGTNKLI